MKTTSSRRRWVRVLKWATVPVCAGIIGFFAAIHLVSLPPALLQPCRATPVLVDVDGRELARLPAGEARDSAPIPLESMGEWLPAVTVALEDHRFRSHPGCDIHATAAAMWRNAKAGRILSGGSTITQQLVKLASRRSERSWKSKIYENFAALKLERDWSKDRILEEYLNRSHYGNRRVGPDAAARAYFGRVPEQLTLRQAIFLAGIPQAPTRFNPWTHADAARAKYRRSLARLLELGFLSAAEAKRLREPPALRAPEPPPRHAPHFVETLRREYPRLPGGEVVTTLDLDLQRMAEARLRLHLSRLRDRGVRDGAVVIVDTRDGAVRAMVGSTDFFEPRRGQINGATLYRSAGSTLKPFLYTRAIQDRLMTAATLLPDTPDAVRAEYIDYDPRNYDKCFWGPVRAREALANSLNVPAVVVLSKVGARSMFSSFEECGLHFARPFSEYGAGLILGNAEVRLLDLTASYTLFSGQGLAVEPRLLSGAPVRHRAFPGYASASIVADMLADNEARQKTFSAFSPLAFEGYRIPCKTGTSSGFRDGWTIGVTAQHAVGVWVGNFDGRPMHEIAAIAGAAPVFHSIVEYLLKHGDTSVPPPVEGLSTAPVCSLTGLSPTSSSPGSASEYFLPGTEPVGNADRYLRSEGETTRLILPAEYALWCSGPLNHLGAEVDDATPLHLVSPRDGTTFLIDSHLPLSQQAIRLEAVGGGNQELTWKINGRKIEPSVHGHLWHLTSGTHIVEVSTSSEKIQGCFTVK